MCNQRTRIETRTNTLSQSHAFPLHTWKRFVILFHYFFSAVNKDSLKASTCVRYCGIKIPHLRTFSCKCSFFPLFKYLSFAPLSRCLLPFATYNALSLYTRTHTHTASGRLTHRETHCYTVRQSGRYYACCTIVIMLNGNVFFFAKLKVCEACTEINMVFMKWKIFIQLTLCCFFQGIKCVNYIRNISYVAKFLSLVSFFFCVCVQVLLEQIFLEAVEFFAINRMQIK